MDLNQKMPPEAVELYTQFIHGEISRRKFMDGLKAYAVLGMTVPAMMTALMPKYAEAQQIRKDDERIKAGYVTIPSPDGNGTIRGYFARPNSADTRDAMPAKLPGVIVIHENRGLNPHTEDVARRFALENFNAFAPDAVTSLGGSPFSTGAHGYKFTAVGHRDLGRWGDHRLSVFYSRLDSWTVSRSARFTCKRGCSAGGIDAA